MSEITYRELADRLDAIKMFNKAPELDPEIYDKLENGSLYDDRPCEWFLNDARPIREWCCATHQYEGAADEGLGENDKHPEQCEWSDTEEAPEIYQWYLISPSDAEYLKDHTDELVFYSDILDEYLWGITHFGTPWEGVTLEFREG